MSKETTLARIDEEIRLGRLGMARDRLHGLVVSFPDDLALRKKLGDLYWTLGYPAAAGQYWFLEPDLGEQADEAFGAFLRSCQNDPRIVLKRLRLRGVDGGMLEPRVRDRVEAQRRAFRKVYGTDPEPDLSHQQPSTLWRMRMANAGCCLLVATLVILVGLGIVQVVGWFNE